MESIVSIVCLLVTIVSGVQLLVSSVLLLVTIISSVMLLVSIVRSVAGVLLVLVVPWIVWRRAGVTAEDTWQEPGVDTESASGPGDGYLDDAVSRFIIGLHLFFSCSLDNNRDPKIPTPKPTTAPSTAEFPEDKNLDCEGAACDDLSGRSTSRI